MKRYILTVLLLSLCSLQLSAQKYVIGSELPDFKSSKSINWLYDAADLTKLWVIDFYSTKNPTSVKFYSQNVENVNRWFGGRAEIVIFNAGGDDDFLVLAQRDNDRQHFAIDTQGDIFKIFSVIYLPYTVIVDADGVLVWQGNLSTLTGDVAADILANMGSK